MKEIAQLHRMAHKAFLDAYNFSSFKQLLYFRLEKEIDEIVPHNANFSDQVFEVVKASHREGWFQQLILEGRSETPLHPQFDVLVNILNGESSPRKHRLAQLGNDRVQLLRMIAEAIIVCVIILLAIAIFAIFAMLASVLLLFLA